MATAVFDLDNTADGFGLRLNDPGDSANNARLLLVTNANNDTKLVHLSNFELAELFYDIHILSNYTLIALISLHIFAVIVHKLIFKENLLKKIL